MTEQPVTYTATITNLTLNHDGFAVVPEAGDTIYIPPGVSKAAKLVPGETRNIRVVPNFQDKAKATRWLGIYVSPPEQEQPEAHTAAALSGDEAEDLEHELYECLLESPEVYMTTQELATRLHVGKEAAIKGLEVLWSEGRVARALVYGHQRSQAELSLWANRVEDFCE